MPPVFRSNSRILSAGRSQRFHHHVATAATIGDCRTLLSAAPADLTVLPFGAGQSLGDSCLNDGGGLILTSRMARVLRADEAKGLIVTEPGVTMGQLAEVSLSRSDG